MTDAAFGCVKNTIRLRGGSYFDLRDPQPDQFTFADVAGALAKICRFGGQIREFYSVAEHSWHCARLAEADHYPRPAVRAVLLHDAAEAFVGDVVKPLKVMLPEYAAVERRVEAAVAAKFGVDFAANADIVRACDRPMLIAERRHFFSADGVVWTGEAEVRRLEGWRFFAWNPTVAESMFTAAAADLGIDVTK